MLSISRPYNSLMEKYVNTIKIKIAIRLILKLTFEIMVKLEKRDS